MPFRRLLACAPIVLLALAPAAAQQPLPPEKQAEAIVAAGRKALDEGNLPVARERFQEVVSKFGNTPAAAPSRLGLAVVALRQENPDYAKLAEVLQPTLNQGNFEDRPQAAYILGACQRTLGLRELEKGQPGAGAAGSKFNAAREAFQTAGDAAHQKQYYDLAARARCDRAEMHLRLNQLGEARGVTENLLKEAPYAKSKHRKLALYYLGLAWFQEKNYAAASKVLNQVAPFTDPEFGLHAEYLVGRLLQLGNEGGEAAVHYEAVLARYEKDRLVAVEALKNQDKLRGQPVEKARLEALVKAAPEAVTSARFHAAGLNYEGGKFAEALAKFQAFTKDVPNSPLAADANLRAALCLVQLKQYDEAAKLLAPLSTVPRLAAQAEFWLGKSALQRALTAEGGDPAKVKAALESLKQAAGKMPGGDDPEARQLRAEAALEIADGLHLARQYAAAASAYEPLFNNRSLPARQEEILQRLASAHGAAGKLDSSDERCRQFRQLFPQSVLLPAVTLREADNAMAKALALEPGKVNPAEILARFNDASVKYREVVDKSPEFERIAAARYGLGVALIQVGNFDEAVKALEAIAPQDRAGDFADAGYLIADCLLRQAPTKADDALQENQIREKLANAAALLESFVSANPKAPEAAAALLKLGHATKRLGAGLADQNERNQTLNRARETLDKLTRDYAQSPLVPQAVLERAKIKALAGDKGGAMNDLRGFLGDAALQKSTSAPLALVHLATLYREQNQPQEAVKVLAEGRKRYDAELGRDTQRAEAAAMLKYHHGVALLESDKPADARPILDQLADQLNGRPLGAEAALRAEQCRVVEGKKRVELARQAFNQAGNDKNKQQEAKNAEKGGLDTLRDGAERLVRRGEDYKGPLPASEARARMFYDGAWAWRTLSELEPADGKLNAAAEEKAQASYRRLIEDFPDTSLAVEARLELAEALGEGGAAEAVKLLKAALEAEPADKPAPPDTLERVRLKLGDALAASGDPAGSAAQFDAVASNAKSPYVAQALYRAGAARLAAKDYAKAVEKLSVFRDRGEFHNRDGVSDRAMLALGQALLGLKQYDAARQAFDTQLSRFGGNNPLAADARYGLGQGLQAQGKFDEAAAAYQAVIAATQSEVAAQAQLGLGHCRLGQKKYPEAAAAFLVVPYTYAAYPELGFAARLEAARAYAANGQKPEAEAALKKLVQEAPAMSVWQKSAAERLAELGKK